MLPNGYCKGEHRDGKNVSGAPQDSKSWKKAHTFILMMAWNFKIWSEYLPNLSGEKCCHFRPRQKERNIQILTEKHWCILSIPTGFCKLNPIKIKSLVIENVEISFTTGFHFLLFIPTDWKNPTGSVRKGCFLIMFWDLEFTITLP